MESVRVTIESLGILIGGSFGLLFQGVPGLFMGLMTGCFIHLIWARLYRKTALFNGPSADSRVIKLAKQPSIGFGDLTYDTKSIRQASKSLERAYQCLGIDRHASELDIKRCFKKLIGRHHPDKLIARGCSESELQKTTEKFQEVSWAYKKIISSKGVSPQ